MGGQQSKNVTILGLDGAGKTTLLKQLMKENASVTFPTIGYQEKSVNYLGTQLLVTDVGGSQKLRQQWTIFFSKINGLVFVIDSVDRQRTQEAALELELLLSDLTKRKLLKIPILVLCNKCDVKTAQTEAEINQQLGLNSFQFQSVSIQRISALTGDGIEDAMKWLISKLK